MTAIAPIKSATGIKRTNPPATNRIPISVGSEIISNIKAIIFDTPQVSLNNNLIVQKNKQINSTVNKMSNIMLPPYFSHSIFISDSKPANIPMIIVSAFALAFETKPFSIASALILSLILIIASL